MRDPQLDALRRQAVAKAQGRVLEIGFGTGRNLPFYPAGLDRLVAVDPNPGMAALAQQRMREAGIEVEHHRITAESLPFDSGSFDCVVSTLTLCSIPDVEHALAEVRRVLRPGGEFLFLEHGRHPAAAMQRWQNRITPLWSALFDGCQLNRDIAALVGGAGLRLADLQHPSLPKAPQWVGYGYLGRAQRLD